MKVGIGTYRLKRASFFVTLNKIINYLQIIHMKQLSYLETLQYIGRR